jgi:hypothetical protein|tara:strand:- start:143 stop:514 length:372 start_codon:yes stop_codon:yes gene_type:complete
MAGNTNSKNIKKFTKAAASTSPLAATALELKKLRDKKKKAKFQEGDYSDIDIKGIIDPKEIEVKSVDLPTRKETGKFKSVPLPTRKEKKTITVPSNSKNIPKFKGGGMATRGLGRAFMKGGKV